MTKEKLNKAKEILKEAMTQIDIINSGNTSEVDEKKILELTKQIMKAIQKEL